MGNKLFLSRVGCALAATLWLSSRLFAAAPGGGGPGGPGGPGDAEGRGGPPQQQTIDLAGRVESLNLNNQRGTLDGLIITTQTQRVQVNLPDSLTDALAKAVNVGDTVQVQVVEEGGPGRGRGPDDGRGGPGRGPDDGRGGPDGRGPPQEAAPDHPVFRLVRMRDALGHVYESNDGPGHAQQDASLTDVVKALNYDHRGTVNGLQLSKGDFVKLPGNVASMIAIRPGDKVSVQGTARPAANGRGNVIDAKTLNGNDLRPTRGGPDGNRGGPGGPGDRGGPDGRGRGPNDQADNRGRGGPGGPGSSGGPNGPGGRGPDMGPDGPDEGPPPPPPEADEPPPPPGGPEMGPPDGPPGPPEEMGPPPGPPPPDDDDDQ